MTGSIMAFPEDYSGAAAMPPPPVVMPNGVPVGGGSPADAAAAGLAAAGNVGVPGDDGSTTEGLTDREGHALSAAEKFPANEADAAGEFQAVGAQGGIEQLMPMVTGLAGAISGAVGGALGPITQVPQQAMQAGQGAVGPLMEAVKSAGGGELDAGGGDGLDGLSDQELLDSLGLEDPALSGGDVGAGGGGGGGDTGSGGGGGGGDATSPTGYMGPPPVPMSSAPTTPAAAPSKPSVVAASGGAPAPATTGMGGGMMPMMPPGMAGAGGGGDSKDSKSDEKRVVAPGVPNGAPVKGRMTVPPSIPVTQTTDAKSAGAPTKAATKRIEVTRTSTQDKK